MRHVWESAFICHVCCLMLVKSRILATTFYHVVLALIHDDTLGYILFHLSNEFIEYIIALSLLFRLNLV